MKDSTKKWLGIGGAVAIAIGAGGMFLSGAELTDASGIVGLAFAGIAAVVNLIRGVMKK